MNRPILLLAGLLAAAGCSDPAAWVEYTYDEDQKLVLLAILNPEVDTQRIELGSSTVGDHALAGDGVWLTGGGESVELSRSEHPCLSSYECFTTDRALEPGVEYAVQARADGYPAVTGTTVTPGPFRIHGYVAGGDPPGTDSLFVSWSPSEGAFRYLVAIHAPGADCVAVTGCTGWLVPSRDTLYSGAVPLALYPRSDGPAYLAVYALDKALYEYLMTGTEGSLFAVPQVQNVEGGYGVVGSWIRRVVELP